MTPDVSVVSLHHSRSKRPHPGSLSCSPVLDSESLQDSLVLSFDFGLRSLIALTVQFLTHQPSTLVSTALVTLWGHPSTRAPIDTLSSSFWSTRSPLSGS